MRFLLAIFFWGGGTLHSSVEQNPADDNTNDADADGTDGAEGTNDADADGSDGAEGTDGGDGSDGAEDTDDADEPRYWALFVDPLVVDDLQTRVATEGEPVAENDDGKADYEVENFPPSIVEDDRVATAEELSEQVSCQSTKHE